MIGSAQAVVTVPASPAASLTAPASAVGVGPLTLDRSTGRLSRLGDLDISGPVVGIWRAPTDNDRDVADDEADLPPMADRWHSAGIDRMVTRLVGIDPAGSSIRVQTRTATPIFDSAVDGTSTWCALEDGSVRLDVDLVPNDRWTTEWARLGLDFEVPGRPRGMDLLGLRPDAELPGPALRRAIRMVADRTRKT